MGDRGALGSAGACPGFDIHLIIDEEIGVQATKSLCTQISSSIVPPTGVQKGINVKIMTMFRTLNSYKDFY